MVKHSMSDPNPVSSRLRVPLSLENVTCVGPNGPVLTDISLTVDEGEWITLFGPCGCGKTALLSLCAGSLRPSSGARLQRDHLRIALASETIGQAWRGSARAEVVRRLARAGVPQSRRFAYADAALDLMGLADLGDSLSRELTHGQRAGLEIAAAIASQPDLLLLDNLVSAMPEPVRARLFAYLDDRRGVEGMAVIHATCSSDEAERAERVLMLDRGRIIASAAPDELLASHAPDTVTIEATDPAAIERTLTGVYDIAITETRDGLRFTSATSQEDAARVLRRPPEGFRAVYITRGDLWRAHAALTARSTERPSADRDTPPRPD